jgi:hypothetical protein
MKFMRLWALGLLALLAPLWQPPPAKAWIYIGCGPYRPWYGPYCYRPYWGPRVVIAPAPVVAVAPPVVVAQPAPVVAVQPTTVVAQSPPVVQEPPLVVQVPPPPPIVQTQAPPPVVQTPPPPPVTTTVQPTNATVVVPPRNLNVEQRKAKVDAYLQLLTSPQVATRLDAVQHLTRLRGPRAVDGLAATLAGDRSSAVREAAARGLGMTGAPRGVPALQRAASYDPDLGVRRAAQLALEVIQTTPRR